MQTIPIELYKNGFVVGSRTERLPARLEAVLCDELQYNHRTFNRGMDAWRADGTRRPVTVEKRLLYAFDGYSRICTRIGFLPRITNLMKLMGYATTITDVNPVHPRPQRYTTDWDGVFADFQLRERQPEALASIVDNPFGGTICAPPGFGKSYLFRALARLYPYANILYVVSRKDVAWEIYRGLLQHFPNVGFFGDGKSRPGRTSVTLAQSMHKVDFDVIDIICGDEAHELITDSYCSKLGLFNNSRNYAFTATPNDRKDGSNIRLEGFFGPLIFDMSYQEAEQLGLVVPIKVEWLDVVMEENPCGDRKDAARERAGIWRNEVRNAIIAEKARSYGPDEQVLIMVKTLDHACHLKGLLPEFTLCYSEGSADTKDMDISMYKRWGLLPDDEPVMTWERRTALKKAFSAGTLKKVIATGVWSTGVNFHPLQVLIRADGASSAIADYQLPGRVSRPYGDSKEFGIVVDCLDQFDTGYRDAARSRRRSYEQKGWVQIMPNTNGLLTGR